MLHIPGDGNIFTAKPEPLAGLLAGIHAHHVALPDFQRPWVWEPEMVRDLLVSVANRYPAGSLLTMPVQSETFSLRPFEGAGEKLGTTKPNLMVLDGQQRLTSLYQTLYRRDGVRTKKRTYHFYLDVGLLLDTNATPGDTASPFEDALFYVVEEKSGKRVRYERITPLYELTTREQEIANGVLPLGGTFNLAGHLSGWKDDYLTAVSGDSMARYKALLKAWEERVEPWLDRIRSYPFPVIELRPDMPLGAICHIFEKVNSTGVPLDVFDLCTALLWAQGFRLNAKWDETYHELKQANVLPMQPLTGTSFLQSIALLDSLDRKRASFDGYAAVGCRKQDLMALRHETVERWWLVLLDGYREASKFLMNNGVLAGRILPYTTLIIPLAAMFADLKRRKGAVAIGTAYDKIARWYWCSVFTQRYSSRVESASAADFEQMMRWLDGGEPPDVVRTFTFRPDVLQEIASIRNAIYRGVLCLLARNGARDFGGGGMLSIALFSDSNQDHHHIFPTDALRQIGVVGRAAGVGDTIVNKTLISAAVNRSIGGKRPSQYIAEMRGKLGMEAFDEILESHEITPDVLAADNWEAFVRDRRERLRRLIAGACGGTVQPFADTDLAAVEIVELDSDVVMAT